MRFPPHLRKWFGSLSEGDVERLEKLISLKPETSEWVDAKNDRELKTLDGAVDFINSSCTAAKVLTWVCGTAATFLAGVVTLAMKVRAVRPAGTPMTLRIVGYLCLTAICGAILFGAGTLAPPAVPAALYPHELRPARFSVVGLTILVAHLGEATGDLKDAEGTICNRPHSFG